RYAKGHGRPSRVVRSAARAPGATGATVALSSRYCGSAGRPRPGSSAAIALRIDSQTLDPPLNLGARLAQLTGDGRDVSPIGLQESDQFVPSLLPLFVQGLRFRGGGFLPSREQLRRQMLEVDPAAVRERS